MRAPIHFITRGTNIQHRQTQRAHTQFGNNTHTHDSLRVPLCKPTATTTITTRAKPHQRLEWASLTSYPSHRTELNNSSMRSNVRAEHQNTQARVWEWRASERERERWVGTFLLKYARLVCINIRVRTCNITYITRPEYIPTRTQTQTHTKI